MYGVIDRFEGEYAVIETDEGEILNIKKTLLPKKVKEGDVINMEKFTIDETETRRRHHVIDNLTNKLFENS